MYSRRGQGHFLYRSHTGRAPAPSDTRVVQSIDKQIWGKREIESEHFLVSLCVIALSISRRLRLLFLRARAIASLSLSVCVCVQNVSRRFRSTRHTLTLLTTRRAARDCRSSVARLLVLSCACPAHTHTNTHLLTPFLSTPVRCRRQ